MDRLLATWMTLGVLLLASNSAGQDAYLKASNTGSGDQFGSAVTLSGNTLVVGAFREESAALGVNGDQNDDSAPSAGAAYVFVHDGVSWQQQAYLKASNAAAGDLFGVSVALDGDTLVVGAQSEDSSAVGVNGDQGSDDASASGAAYVFVRDGTTWTQEAYLKASNTGANDSFGSSVSISGNTIVVGAFAEDSAALGVNGNQASNMAAQSGAAYVFVRDGVTWVQEAYLKASNTDVLDLFGFSVAVSGETVVVGAANESSAATGIDGDQLNNLAMNAGAAYVFERSGSTWAQQAYLKASNTDPHDWFGDAVAIDGDVAVVGAYREGSAANGVDGDEQDDSSVWAGAAYVFERNVSVWSQQAYLKATVSSTLDHFGDSVAVSGTMVAVGARNEDIDGVIAGAAFVFGQQVPGTWRPQDYWNSSISDVGDMQGGAVAVSGARVVVGAVGEDSNAIGVGGDGSDNSVLESGAAFVTTVSGFGFLQNLGYGHGQGPLTQPVLTGSGPLEIGQLVYIDLALPDLTGLTATAYYVMGRNQYLGVFQGGVLVPTPEVVIPTPVDTTGPTFGIKKKGDWPVGMPSGTVLYLQYWVYTGPGTGYISSNALALTSD